MQDNAVESISGCSYENICDEGMEISVGGKKRLLPVDTVVICAGACPSPRHAKPFDAAVPA
jgi:2,4-dienoyl-CoA reductase (NADPH2)